MDYLKKFKQTVFLMLITCSLMPPADCTAKQDKNYTGMFLDAMEKGQLIAITQSNDRYEQEFLVLSPIKRINNNYFRCLGIIEKEINNETLNKYETIKIKMNKTADTPEGSGENSVSLKRDLPGAEIIEVLIHLKSNDDKKISLDREKVLTSTLGSKIFQLNINDYNQIGIFQDTVRLDLIKNYLTELRSKANAIKSAFLQQKPLKITFKDDSEIIGIMDYPDVSYLDQMLDLSPASQRIEIDTYPEFEAVQYKNVPYVVKKWPERESFRKISVSRQNNKGNDIKRTGLFTNRYTWMGRNNFTSLDNFYYSCSLLNDYQEIGLYSISFINTNYNTTSLFINDLVNIKNIELYGHEINDYEMLYNHIRDINATLKICWEQRNNENIYLTFKHLPAFKGKLIEYVPSFHLSSIPHAVIKNENNQIIMLRRPSEIESLILESEFSDIELNEKNAKLRFDRTPGKSINAEFIQSDETKKEDSPENAFKFVSDKEYTDGTEIQILNATVHDVTSRYTNIMDKIELSPDEEVNACVIDITMTFNTVSEEIPEWISFEKFNFFDKSGKSFDKFSFINQKAQALSDVMMVEENTVTFGLLVYIPKDISQFYMQYLDMQPIEINVTKNLKKPE